MDTPPPHSQRMTLWGTPQDLHFPPLCAHCGGATVRRIAVAKTFRRSSGSDTPDSDVTVSAAVPFCEPCIARHRELTPPADPWRIFSSHLTPGAILASPALLAAALFCAVQALRELAAGRTSAGTVFALSAIALGWFGLRQAQRVWRHVQALRTSAQTAVTESFDFGDHEPPPFEAPRFVCTMRNERFAAAFRDLNRQAEYERGSDAAVADRQTGNRQFRIVATIVAVIVFALLVRGWLR